MRSCRRIGIGAARLMAIAAMCAAAAGCGDDMFGVYDGRVRFVLTSAAAPVDNVSFDAEPPTVTSYHAGHTGGEHAFFDYAYVTLSAVQARNPEGELVDIVMDLPVVVDVTTLEDGRAIDLPMGELPPSAYDQLVLEMARVDGRTKDGTPVSITPRGWTAILSVCPFEVDDRGATVLDLRFALTEAFVWQDGQYRFQPRFTCGEARSDGSR